MIRFGYLGGDDRFLLPPAPGVERQRAAITTISLLKADLVAGGLFRRRRLDLLRSLIGEQWRLRRRQCRAVGAELHPTLEVEVRALPAAEARAHEHVCEGHHREHARAAEAPHPVRPLDEIADSNGTAGGA